MIYCNRYGQATNSNSMFNSFNLTKETIDKIAEKIGVILREEHNLFFNIQIPSEGTQLDILMYKGYSNQGLHQRGISIDDLIIGIIGFGTFGFECGESVTTSYGYYQEKLGLYSELLFDLFNKVRTYMRRW